MPEPGFFSETMSNIGRTAGFIANPIGATIGLMGSEAVKSREAQQRLENQNMPYQDPFSSGSFSNNPYGVMSPASPATSDSGFFGGLRSFGREASGFISDIAPALNFFGVGGSSGRTNSGAATTIINQRPDETSTSGELLGANLGMGSNILQAASRFARSPGGGTAIGFGAGALGAALGGGSDGKPRITRRMKSDVRRIYNMSMGNPDITAQILNQMGTYPRINFDATIVFFILTKRFRNDGPVVTKAAVRKTKSTLRRMKGVVDMYNSVCKPTTRRAPMRRAAPKAVQLIKN